MNALTLVFVGLCVFAIAYRFYGLFLARNMLHIDDARATPAVRFADGHDYVATNEYVLFGHHFAAIAAAGPLLGPVLAAQFGYMPGALWILFGCVLGGGVHDMVVLFASVRHKGMSLATIAEKEIGKVTGHVAAWAVLFILILTLAGLSIAVVNAMHDSPWATFTVFITMPIAIVMGLYMRYWRPGDVTGASVLGVVLLFLGVVCGPFIVDHPLLKNLFDWSREEIALIIIGYGFVASILPVWLLLAPRDYLSTYLKMGTILCLALGIAFVRPELRMEAFTRFCAGGGPVIAGPVLPFIFITIACGAISGFHAIIATGTTPKMIGAEHEIPFVGYGAMIAEGFVAIMALISACVLVPADYYAINSTAQAFSALHMQVKELPALMNAVQENVMHRPGGAVSLAVGMAHVFSSIPFMKGLMSYWYHFAIMFEAVFVLTAVDAGTRVGRFFLQELAAKAWPRFGDKEWQPGVIITSAVFTATWGYLLYTGNIASIWPLFGMSNQLLAACGLIVVTTMLIRLGRARYIWSTAIPGLFMACVTFWAGYLQVTGVYLPQKEYMLAVFAVIVMALMFIVFVGALTRWVELLRMHTPLVDDEYGEHVLVKVEE